MTLRLPRQLAGALTACMAFTGLPAQAAEPAPIGDVNSAARAIMATEGAAGSALRPLDDMTRNARLLILQTLSWLNAGTTPAAVVASRRGVAVPCPLGGTVLAFLPRSGKRVLRGQVAAT